MSPFRRADFQADETSEQITAGDNTHSLYRQENLSNRPEQIRCRVKVESFFFIGRALCDSELQSQGVGWNPESQKQLLRSNFLVPC